MSRCCTFYNIARPGWLMHFGWLHSITLLAQYVN